MGKALVIAEKPSVARELAVALLGQKPGGGNTFTGKGPDGCDLTITSGRGHLMELAKPEAYNQIHGKDFGKWIVGDLPILPQPGWKFIQLPRQDAKDMVAAIRKLVADHSGCEVINACDAGREGELIFRKIMGACSYDKATTKLGRMWWSSMTAESILESYMKRGPLSKYDGMALAGYTRDEADWLMGMNMTVLATKTLPRGEGDWKLWSVGRVQTPTLALIVERDLAIESFATEPFYEVYAQFDGVEAKSVLDALATRPDRAALLGVPKISDDREKKAFWDKALAERYCGSAKAAPQYSITEKQSEKSSTVLPFNLAEAQKALFKKFGMAATESLELLQSLYEAKLISYPRTDSRCWNESPADKDKIYGAAVAALKHLKATRQFHICTQTIAPRDTAYKARAFNDKGVSDHYAISPTEVTDGVNHLEDKALYAYLIILQATLMAFDEPSVTAVVTRRYVQKDAQGPYTPAEFKAEKERMINPGWTRWQKKEEAKAHVPLPPLPAAGVAQIGDVTIKSLKTNPPKPFGDDTLLTAMERAGTNLSAEEIQDPAKAEEMAEAMKGRGIGTPATRAAILKTLETRKYIVRGKKSLSATPNGRRLIQSMNELDPASTSAAMTAEWELVLKRMENGEATVSRENFLQGLLDQFIRTKTTFMAASTRSTGPSGLVEGTPIEAAICPKSQKPMLDRGIAFEAPGFKDVLLWKTAFGKDWTPEDYIKLLAGVVAKAPVTFTGLKTREGKEYSAPLTIDPKDGKVVIHEVFEKVKGVNCPKKGTAIEDYGNYWVAGGWPKLRLYKNAFGRAWKLEEYISLLESIHKGTPVLVSNLVSKAGKSYSATFSVTEDRWDLKFPDRAA